MLLTCAPILRIDDLEKYFVFWIDACKEGLGGVLMQEGHVIYYESMKLNEHERNYITHDLKLLAFMRELKM